MAEFRFQNSVNRSDVRQIRVGDSVLLDGIIFGVRDGEYDSRVRSKGCAARAIGTGRRLLHTAPNVRKVGPGKYEPICVGTTTSMRMDRFTEGLLRDYGVRAILGKGGLSATQRGADAKIWRVLPVRHRWRGGDGDVADRRDRKGLLGRFDARVHLADSFQRSGTAHGRDRCPRRQFAS